MAFNLYGNKQYYFSACPYYCILSVEYFTLNITHSYTGKGVIS